SAHPSPQPSPQGEGASIWILDCRFAGRCSANQQAASILRGEPQLSGLRLSRFGLLVWLLGRAVAVRGSAFPGRFRCLSAARLAGWSGNAFLRLESKRDRVHAVSQSRGRRTVLENVTEVGATAVAGDLHARLGRLL